MTRPEAYFLLIYDVPRRHVEVEEFGAAIDEAMKRYAVLESEHRDDPDVEVVLVGADSIDTVKRTHGHYFNGVASDQFDALLEDVLENTRAAVSRATSDKGLDKQAT
jgi:uracil-DNA glycosylase